MHNKFHAMLHLPEELRRCDILLTCWVHERKHKLVTEFATFVRNTRVYERSVVSETVCKQLASMRAPRTFSRVAGLVKPTPCPKRVREYVAEQLELLDDAEVFHCAVMRHSPCTLSKRKDVVLISGLAFDRPHTQVFAGEVLHHLEVLARPHQEPISIVSVWDAVKFNSNDGYAVWGQ